MARSAGKKLKLIGVLKKICNRFISEFKNLNLLFKNFKKFFSLPFFFRQHVVAGRKLLIPAILKKQNEVSYGLKYIKNGLVTRSEIKYIDKMYGELRDIYLEQNVSYLEKRIAALHDELTTNFVNLRFIRFQKK